MLGLQLGKPGRHAGIKIGKQRRGSRNRKRCTLFFFEDLVSHSEDELCAKLSEEYAVGVSDTVMRDVEAQASAFQDENWTSLRIATAGTGGSPARPTAYIGSKHLFGAHVQASRQGMLSLAINSRVKALRPASLRECLGLAALARGASAPSKIPTLPELRRTHGYGLGRGVFSIALPAEATSFAALLVPPGRKDECI